MRAYRGYWLFLGLARFVYYGFNWLVIGFSSWTLLAGYSTIFSSRLLLTIGIWIFEGRFFGAIFALVDPS
jgi:hypothetical protein